MNCFYTLRYIFCRNEYPIQNYFASSVPKTLSKINKYTNGVNKNLPKKMPHHGGDHESRSYCRTSHRARTNVKSVEVTYNPIDKYFNVK